MSINSQTVTLLIKSYTYILLVQEICICLSCSNFEKGWKTQANSYESVNAMEFLLTDSAFTHLSKAIGQILRRCAKVPGYCIIEVDNSFTIYPFVLVSLGSFLKFV